MTEVCAIRRDGYLHVELTEPARRNPLSAAMLAGLRAALREHVDETVNTVVISGAGGTFSAGADLTELTGTVGDVAVDDAIAETLDLVRRLPVLTIAAVEGPCRGGAVDLVLACDLVIAGAEATFAVPAVRLGIMYNPDAVARWHRRLPRPTLVRLLLAGDRLDAESAKAGGLVAEVAPAGEAVAAAGVVAQRLADVPSTVVAGVKGLLVDLDDGADLTRAHEARHQLLAAPERLAALHAVRGGVAGDGVARGGS